MAWPGPGRAQGVVPPNSLWQPAEFTWRIQPVSRSLAVGGRRTGRVCAPKPTAPPGISIVLSPARFMRRVQGVYKGCTKGVQGKLKGCSPLRSLYSPCASGVLPLYTTRRADTPPDPEELTRAVPATTTAPHSNRKQRIPPGKSPGAVSGRFLAALESVRRVSRCEA